MVEVAPDRYVSQRNLDANGRPIRWGTPAQFAKKEEEAARHVQRGKRKRIIPLRKWFEGFNADQLGGRWWTDGGSEATYGRKLTSEPIPDLTRARWFAPILSADEEIALVLRARAGDTAAGNKLFRRFHRVLLRIAWQRGFDALGDDRMAIAAHGFAKALAGFNVNSGNRLAPYLKLCVRGTLLDAMKDLRRRKGFRDVPKDEWPELKGGDAIEFKMARDDHDPADNDDD